MLWHSNRLRRGSGAVIFERLIDKAPHDLLLLANALRGVNFR